MKYRKKPVVIEAVQYTGNNINELWDVFGAGEIYGPTEKNLDPFINTLEGTMTVSVNDYVIKGVQGELYPCKPDIFEATYDKVEE